MIRSSRKVRKRDGREVPFDQAKIAYSIGLASGQVGGVDQLLAEELASVVAMYIERQPVDRIPTIDDISDLVEKVLQAGGHGKEAKAFILERDRRDRLRAAVKVRDTAPAALGQSIRPTVDARARARVSAWSKGKIVEALMLEANLPASEAEEIAAVVENRVFTSGLTRVTTTLIRALVDNELFERGFEGILGRQSTIGMPRFDLDRLARSGAESVDGMVRGTPDIDVARASWSQYSQIVIYSSEVTDAHLDGRIHVGGLGSPTRFQSLEVRLQPSVLSGPEGAEWSDRLRLLACRVAEVADEAVTLRGIEGVMASQIMVGPEDAPLVAHQILMALARAAELPSERPRMQYLLPIRCGPELLKVADQSGISEAEARGRYRRLLHQLLLLSPRLKAGDAGIRVPKLLINVAGAADDDVLVLEQLALAEEDADVATALCDSSPFPGSVTPVCATCLRIDINVAHAAFRARRFETSAVMEQLEGAVELAGAASEARSRYFDDLPGYSGPREKLGLLGAGLSAGGLSTRYEIAVAGLDAACRIAFDADPGSDERSREFAISVVQGLQRCISREAEKRKLPLVLSFTADRKVLTRFGSVDYERFSRGRDVHGVPHDGNRYLYGSVVTGGQAEPVASAALEANLREKAVPAPVPSSFPDVAERVRFLGELASCHDRQVHG